MRSGRPPAALRAQTLTPEARRREFRRVLRRLAEPGARLDAEDAQRFGVKVPKNGYKNPVLCVAGALAQALRAEGLVRAANESADRFEITPEGLSYLKRSEAEDAPFAAQHSVPGERYIGEGQGRGARHRVNLAESPLTWLGSRKGADGRPLLAAPHLEAGERLREDFTRAQLMQRVTVDWQRPMTSGSRGDQGLTISEAAMAARQRLHAALLAVGLEFEEVLLSVCCHLRGLEDVERRLGWPPRAGKIVLKIALDRLARHYGIIRKETRPALRAWAP